MARRRSQQAEALSAWPGYVDALSTLLMVIIFVLLVFVLAQAFLSVALSGRERALTTLNQKLAALSDTLALEKSHNATLAASVAGLARDLAAARKSNDTRATQRAPAKARAAAATARQQSLQAARDRFAAQAADTALQLKSAEAQASTLSSQLTLSATQIAQIKKDAATLQASAKADRATITAKLADLARLTEQVQALTALRDQLTAQVKTAAARSLTAAEKNRALAVKLADETRLGHSALAQMALLNQQVAQLRAQLGGLAAALDASETASMAKDVQIANLGQRLNAALAAKVQQLQRYRSDFLGELRRVLANRPGISVVGDRFVFQSQVLFPSGSDQLTPAGLSQIDLLAATLKKIIPEIPKNLPWILRVDGHADRAPITGGPFTSNWELSAARAITVVKLLIADGIPSNRLAATGFGDTQPLDPANTPAAFARNRRIELRLASR